MITSKLDQSAFSNFALNVTSKEKRRPQQTNKQKTIATRTGAAEQSGSPCLSLTVNTNWGLLV